MTDIQSPPEQPLPVTQEDREAAAYLHACEYGSATPGYDWILAGECDEEPHVQAFAHHRIAAEARTRDAEDRAAVLEECLGQIAGKNDLSGVPDEDVESAARNALCECELLARAALSPKAGS